MNDVWNLNPLYQGFEDPAFETDLAELKAKVAQFESFTEKDPDEDDSDDYLYDGTDDGDDDYDSEDF